MGPDVRSTGSDAMGNEASTISWVTTKTTQSEEEEEATDKEPSLQRGRSISSEDETLDDSLSEKAMMESLKSEHLFVESDDEENDRSLDSTPLLLYLKTTICLLFEKYPSRIDSEDTCAENSHALLCCGDSPSNSSDAQQLQLVPSFRGLLDDGGVRTPSSSSVRERSYPRTLLHHRRPFLASLRTNSDRNGFWAATNRDDEQASTEEFASSNHAVHHRAAIDIETSPPPSWSRFNLLFDCSTPSLDSTLEVQQEFPDEPSFWDDELVLGRLNNVV